MSTVAMSGNDTIIIQGHILANLADTDVGMLTFPNDIAQVKTGKNGNSLYALNETGRQCEVTVRVIRGSADDKFLNGLLVQQLANFAGFVLLNGEFIKQMGDGLGNVLQDIYVMGGGVFMRSIDAKSNTEGDVEQSVAVYKMKFTNAPRALT